MILARTVFCQAASVSMLEVGSQGRAQKAQKQLLKSRMHNARYLFLKCHAREHDILRIEASRFRAEHIPGQAECLGQMPPVPHRFEQVEGDAVLGIIARQVAVEREGLAVARPADPDLVRGALVLPAVVEDGVCAADRLAAQHAVGARQLAEAERRQHERQFARRDRPGRGWQGDIFAALRGEEAHRAREQFTGFLTQRKPRPRLVGDRTVDGNFVYGEGENRQVLQPGFRSFVGLDNITRVITDRNVRDPFVRVFLWSVMFAGGSVALTLGLGLLLAVVLNSRDVVLRTLFRSILIIPYALPGWLMVTTWRGLLNPVYGPVNAAIESLIGVSPQWFADPTLAKAGVLFVNMYLGFPYMMLISLGVLQSIPPDMMEAATIDGANAWQRFRKITFPLLLVALAPLLVVAFAFNFNNFTVIELFNTGGPPISVATVAGHTDILLSYTYRLAFAGASGTDYGFAAAVSIFIFIIVGSLTIFNFRLTRRFEEIGASS